MAGSEKRFDPSYESRQEDFHIDLPQEITRKIGYGRALRPAREARDRFCRYDVQVSKEAEMKGSRFGVAICVTALIAASAGAQQTRGPRPLTNAQLQARVKTLQEENNVLTNNYDLLLASCRPSSQ